jgi:hypothetical protein
MESLNDSTSSSGTHASIASSTLPYAPTYSDKFTPNSSGIQMKWSIADVDPY